METTVVYCGYNGIMEKNMETTVVNWAILGSWKINGDFGPRVLGSAFRGAGA